MLENKKIILATQSTSRIELVNKYNLNWQCVKNKFNETLFKSTIKLKNNIKSICSFTQILAQKKALSVVNDFSNSIIIGCDTIIFCNGKILEKPKSQKEAKCMLEFLQNKIQFCITGISLIDTNTKKYKNFYEITKLIFKNFDDKEYNFLLNETNPLENAGAYEYCDRIKNKVQIIRGSEDNIIGIPIKKIQLKINEL